MKCARLTYPSYVLGKRISIGNFLERIEVIVAVIWIISIYFKLSICYYGLSLGLAQIMKLNDYRILLFPLAFLLIPYAILSEPSTVHYQTYNAAAWTPFSLTICFVLPMLLFVTARIKKKLIPSRKG
ncbi:GerAB/ArcD/ProY family transporter [Neobacillus sp. M.A.Huq-85]|nr:GerAB/ArcD/ProY family transporter [Neobacillus cucumis]